MKITYGAIVSMIIKKWICCFLRCWGANNKCRHEEYKRCWKSIKGLWGKKRYCAIQLKECKTSIKLICSWADPQIQSW